MARTNAPRHLYNVDQLIACGLLSRKYAVTRKVRSMRYSVNLLHYTRLSLPSSFSPSSSPGGAGAWKTRPAEHPSRKQNKAYALHKQQPRERFQDPNILATRDWRPNLAPDCCYTQARLHSPASFLLSLPSPCHRRLRQEPRVCASFLPALPTPTS